jgi:hypothetical protein
MNSSCSSKEKRGGGDPVRYPDKESWTQLLKMYIFLTFTMQNILPV